MERKVNKFSPEEVKAFTARELTPGLWDLGNPESIYTRMPEDLAEYFIKAKMHAPHLFEIGEDELREVIQAESGKSPLVTENQVRMRFWHEYDRVCAGAGGPLMSVKEICLRVCTTDTFFHYIRIYSGAAWMACMPTNHEEHLMEMLNFGSYRMRELMRTSSIDPVTKKVNVKLAELQAKLYHAAELRAYGAIPQTVRNLNVNLHDPRGVNKAIEAQGTALIEDKIAEMERSSRKIIKHVEKVDV